MKIGIDARFWNETGVGRYIRNLVRELQKIDSHNSYILFIRKQDRQEIQKFVTSDRWQLVESDIHWHSLREQVEFPRILQRQSLDLMHFPYFSMPVLYRGNFLVTIHDLILHHFPTGEATTLHPFIYKTKFIGYKTVMNLAAQRAKKIIAVSQATKDEIVEHLHVEPDKVVVTYEGIDATLQGKSKENRYGKYFLHVGNVYPHKNCKRLVEGFLAANLLKETKLLFVGREDYFMSKLKASLSSNERVVFLHSVSDEELRTLYAHAIATVVPSLMEGFGLPALEAMENRSLVLVSDIPSLREIAQEAAVYCSPTDLVDIAQKLEEVYSLSQKDKEALREKGVIIAKKFSWERMAKETLAVYERSNNI